MSKLESRCEELICHECPFRDAKIICNLAHNNDLSLGEVLKLVKKDIYKVENIIKSQEENNKKEENNGKME